MRKIIDIASAILALALAGALVWQSWRLTEARNRAQEAISQAQEYQGSLASLQAAVEAQKRADQVARDLLAKRAEQAEARAAKAKKELKELENAIKANEDWASEPIPEDVLRALAQ